MKTSLIPLDYRALVNHLHKCASESGLPDTAVNVAAAYRTAAVMLQGTIDKYGVPMTEEEAEKSVHTNYILGMAIALERKDGALRRRAGETFAQGEAEDKARLYRDLADECKAEAIALREEAKK